ncbi:hypothetical protein A5765_01430 [Mycolicibacterium celeriflavum]|uniref:hypothetical protein n=1 Tax=Mycolicibacterium celeriflavum TaxID=1249101 RepID=UPI0007FC2F0C|nr:hypothetical protein [Mycolicibacterium celeriflavum]OBG22634.1 hypothetical protein A5765_01430 [Mycolicibacterium celeriflavum]
MPNHIEFDVATHTPTLEHYRRDWTPGPGVALAGMWIGAVVNDTAGQTFWGLRGADDFLAGMTHVVSPITGFKRLQPSLDGDPPHLFAEYSTIDWFEPMQYADGADRVQLSFPSGRIERDSDGFHWYDAAGRWEMHGKNVTDIFTVRVPPQDDIADEVYYRHELLAATGTIEGVPVSGYLHQDFAYGPAGKVYPELPVVRQLQGMWVSWLHEYDDGQWGGGSFWQGRDDLEFGPGYQLKDGVTTAHNDIVATPTFNDDGKLTALETTIGSDSYTFKFDTAGSYIHYFGKLTHSSSLKHPARSWCWVEYAGDMLTPEVLDMMMQQFRLARGR